MIPLGGMKKLRILSLGRNNLKRIEKLEEVAETLEELWASYNQIATLDGVVPLTNLTTLYLSNNKIKDWEELAKLVRLTASARAARWAHRLIPPAPQSALPNLKDVLFVGNPIYEGISTEEARIQVLKRIPNVKKIDGDMVSPDEREAAESA